MPFSVEAALDSHILSLEEERLPDGMWHPSSLFGCARRAVYDFRGEPKAPLEAKSRRIFRMGHVVHALIQDAVGTAEGIRFFFPEVKIVDPERGLKGHADGLGLLEDGTWVVFEFKSMNSNAFRYAKELPKDDHRKQVSSYVSVLRRHGGTWKLENDAMVAQAEAADLEIEYTPEGSYATIPPIPGLSRVLIVYLSKDDLSVLTFEQTHSDQKEAWLDGYLARLRQHIDEETLPLRLPNKLLDSGNISPTQRNYLCGYCPFAEACWDRDKEGVS